MDGVESQGEKRIGDTAQSRVFQMVGAERGVLGALLAGCENQSGNARNFYYDEILGGEYGLKPFHFAPFAHQALFRAIEQVNADVHDGNWDIRAVVNRLAKNRRLAREGAKPGRGQLTEGYLADISSSPAAMANMKIYCRMIIDAWRWRKLNKAFVDARAVFMPSGEDWDPKLTPFQALEKSYGILMRAEDKTRGNFDDVHEGHEVAEKLIDDVADYINTGDDKNFRGLQTSIWQFDKATAGLRPGEMTVIGARTNVGKTALGIWLASRTMTNVRLLANDENAPIPAVYFVSAEMAPSQIVARMIASISQINSNFARTPQGITADHLRILAKASGELRNFPFYIGGGYRMNMDEVRIRASRIHRKHLRDGGEGLGLMVVDYLQMLRGDPDKFGVGKYSNPVEELANISHGLKRIALDLNCAVLALAQLNRNPESRASGEASLADLRGSGAIEQDADFVAFMSDKEGKNLGGDIKEISLRLLKSRYGEKNLEWVMRYNPKINKFSSDPNGMPEDMRQSPVWNFGTIPTPTPQAEESENNSGKTAVENF